MKNKKKLRVLIIAIAIAISSVFIYKASIAPKLYDKYLNTGIKYLMDGDYEEAILAFDKAIKIEHKSTESRVYQAKAYIGNEEFDKAVEVLEEAQNIDIRNEELLKEILEILNEIDSDIAYEILDRFIEAVGKGNISEEIKNILDLADKAPSEPIVDPKPGTYVNSISIKLKLDKLKLGHIYYYTLDGTYPNKESEKYRGKIEITESTTLNIIGYNKKGDSTEVSTFEYIIDKNILEEVENSISNGEKLIDDTIVGSNIGNISKENKDKLQYIVTEAKDILSKDLVSYEQVKDLNNKIKEAIEEFKENIIQPTDKNKLKSAISNAQNLYENSEEGNNAGQYKAGSKASLLKVINEAKKINNDKTANQKQIDEKTDSLNNAINKFKKAKISSNIEAKILGKYTYNSGGLICKFTKNRIISGWQYSEAYNAEIYSKREEGNTIYYSTNEGEIKIELINDNTINMNGRIDKLLTAQQLISKVYEERGSDFASYEGLAYWGITQRDIDNFYSNK